MDLRMDGVVSRRVIFDEFSKKCQESAKRRRNQLHTSLVCIDFYIRLQNSSDLTLFQCVYSVDTDLLIPLFSRLSRYRLRKLA